MLRHYSGKNVPKCGFLFLTGLMMFFMSFHASSTFAEESVVDNVSLTVEIACSLTGIGMDTHVATINPGIYRSDIGTTTVNAICNDNEGFAIYATGYTGNVVGGENSNKLVGVQTNQTISTGVATGPVNNNDVSNWAMKLGSIADPAPTYPIIIAGSAEDPLKENNDPDFTTFSLVPNKLTKVAYRTSKTDVGPNAVGSSFTTTYATYVSKTQVADTYSGKVKYTLVHPHDVLSNLDDLVGVTLLFDQDVDIESFVSLGNESTYLADLDFAIKITASDIADYLGISDLNISTWEQLIDALPDFVASFGATNINSDMEITEENGSFTYLHYYNIHGSDSDTEYLNYGSDYENRLWSHLPTSIGSIDFEMDGDYFSFRSIGQLLRSFCSGAWLDEQYLAGGWTVDLFRTIYIYGGNDTQDPQLIRWLKDNASILSVDASSADDWAPGALTFNGNVSITGTDMYWDVNGSMYNAQYVPYGFEYIDINNDYGVPILSFFYSTLTPPYTFGDGFVYVTEDLDIPAFGIDYDAGWYFGNNQNLTGYIGVSPPSITIDGGSDVTDPGFIEWIKDNTWAE